MDFVRRRHRIRIFVDRDWKSESMLSDKMPGFLAVVLGKSPNTGFRTCTQTTEYLLDERKRKLGGGTGTLVENQRYRAGPDRFGQLQSDTIGRLQFEIGCTASFLEVIHVCLSIPNRLNTLDSGPSRYNNPRRILLRCVGSGVSLDCL